MKVVITLAAADGPEVAEAQVAFHLHAGFSLVLLARSAPPTVVDVLQPWVSRGLVHLVDVDGSAIAARSVLVRSAVVEHGADWVVDARSGEFWWPREKSVQEVLEPIPPRYGVVNGLVRQFVSTRDGGPVATVRVSLLPAVPQRGGAVEGMVRPVYRAHPTLDPVQRGGPGTRQPLRSWYPLEVLTIPRMEAPLGDDELARGLEDGSLVADERLRNALDALRGEEGFVATRPGVPPAWLTVPTVVDDATYAIECAEVDDVDLERLDAHIRELERRIGELEQRLLPRIVRRLSRGRRPSG